MSLTIKLYALLTIISSQVETWRAALLARIWGISQGAKPPVCWRVRENLPDSGEWPTVSDQYGQPVHSIWVTGAVRRGSIKPVPAPPDFYKEKQ